MNFADPQTTIDLLRKLVDKHRMTNRHFAPLHHFYPKQHKTINPHIKWAQKTGTFQAGGNNERVARRLAECLRILDQGGTWDNAIAGALKACPR
jgi:hypothetical protein